MKDYNNIEGKIDAFLKKEMSSDDLKVFQNEINSDEQLRLAVAERKLELQSMELMLEDDLRNKFSKWAKVEGTPTKEKGGFNFLFLIPLFLMAGIALYFFTQNSSEKVTPQSRPLKENTTLDKEPVEKEKSSPAIDKPVKENEVIEKVEAPVLEKSKNKNELNLIAFEPILDDQAIRYAEESNLQVAYKKLKANEYDAAVRLYSNILINSKDDKTKTFPAKFYLGVAYYKNGNYKSAIPYLLEMSGKEYFLLKEDAEWWYLLALIKDDKLSKAKLLLSSISNDKKHGFNLKAISLLEKL